MLYPFNVDNKIYDPYKPYYIKTKNKKIRALLKGIEVNNHTLSIKDESLKPYEDKILEILKKLNQSLITEICYITEDYDAETYNINVSPYDSECTCLICQFSRFDFKTLFKTIRKERRQPSPNFQEKLQLGFFTNMIGNPLDSWELLNQIRGESENNNDKATQFIARYNSLYLKRFIRSDEREVIIPQIDSIDLYDEIQELNVSIELRDELIKIKEGYFLNTSLEKIEKLYYEILLVKELYDNGGNTIRDSLVRPILTEINIFYKFHMSNHIMIDDSRLFRKTITKAIESLIISFSTSPRYKERYSKFDERVMSVMILYIRSDYLNKLFQKYEIKKFPIFENGRNRFTEKVLQFFESHYNERKQFKRTIKPNQDIYHQSTFSHFRDMLRNSCNNIFTVLTLGEFEKKELIPIIQAIIDFISISDDFYQNNWEYAARFFAKKITLLNKTQILKILNLSLKGKIHNVGENVFGILCNALENNKIEIDNEKNFKKLLNIITLPCESCGKIHNIKSLLDIYKVGNQENKKLVEERTVKRLEEKWDNNFYQQAVFSGIFTPQNFPTFYERYVSYVVKSCHPNYLQKEKETWIAKSYAGINGISCLAYMKVDFKQTEIQKIAETSAPYNWLINFEIYDYEEFNPQWLLVFCPYYVLIQLYKVETLKYKVEKFLKNNYDKKLAKIYFDYLITSPNPAILASNPE